MNILELPSAAGGRFLQEKERRAENGTVTIVERIVTVPFSAFFLALANVSRGLPFRAIPFQPPHTAGGAWRGIAGAVRLRANGEGPG